LRRCIIPSALHGLDLTQQQHNLFGVVTTLFSKNLLVIFLLWFTLYQSVSLPDILVLSSHLHFGFPSDSFSTFPAYPLTVGRF
jgi:hypothetical protein